MGFRWLRGREFTRGMMKDAAPIAVVNETMAARYWKGQNRWASGCK